MNASTEHGAFSSISAAAKDRQLGGHHEEDRKRSAEEGPQTSPSGPNEDEQVTEDDMKAALNDIYGMNEVATVEEAEEMLQKARSHLKEAFELIPNEQKTAYLEALERVPHLVEIESSPDRYLRHCAFDPWAAARQIAGYWEKRKELFGDRAFLPMTLTNGAMSEADIEVLKTGYLMVLPDDKHGRAVLTCDRSRLTERANPAMRDHGKRLRCSFYTISVLSESESCMQNGLVILFVICDKSRSSTFENVINQEKAALLQSGVMPLSVKALHVVNMTKRPILMKMIQLMLKQFQRWEYLKQRIVTHTVESREQLLEELEQYGFDAENIPKVPLGGRWTFGCFKHWMSDRLRIEKSRYEMPASLDSSKSSEVAEKARQEEERSRKRKMNAAYARRKRAKETIEIEVMQEQVDRLWKQNQNLKDAGVQLEQQLKLAKRLVQQHDAQLSSQLDAPSGWNLSVAQFPAGAASLPSNFPSVGAESSRVPSHINGTVEALLAQAVARNAQQELLLRAEREQLSRELLAVQQHTSRAALLPPGAAILGSQQQLLPPQGRYDPAAAVVDVVPQGQARAVTQQQEENETQRGPS